MIRKRKNKLTNKDIATAEQRGNPKPWLIKNNPIDSFDYITCEQDQRTKMSRNRLTGSGSSMEEKASQSLLTFCLSSDDNRQDGIRP
ncbi:hypothetical protein CEXT_202601 [Caerostris extrusa]|uniref:Uncharacterized protein n=1 Tax=Caerostris extrusa TaxID=172846 RepID=A0AAV4R8D4_CAEEX|nr:hypothetical protein CEXT_202601 [Caerostris extrusa]